MKFQLERILLFSDAVFAIAITMMIIEIKPPHLDHDISFSQAMKALLSKFPIFIGNVISFYMIAHYWMNHHKLMQYLHRYNTQFIVINFALLLAISMIPFSTTFIFENILSNTPLTIIVYNVNHIIATLLSYRLVAYSFNPKHGLCEKMPVEEFHNYRLQVLYSMIVFIVVSMVSFANPSFSPLLYSLFGFQDLILKKWFKKPSISQSRT